MERICGGLESSALNCFVKTHFFLTYEWLSTWWESYGEGKELEILLALDRNQLKGIAPLFLEKGRGMKVLRFLGSRYIPADFLNFIIESGKEKEVIPPFLDFFCREKGWDKIFFNDMEDEPNTLSILEKWTEDHHLPYIIERHAPCPFMELPDTLEAFHQKLDPVFWRGLQKSALRRLHRDHEVEFNSSLGLDEIDKAIEKMALLHTERWHAAGKPGQFEDLSKQEFYKKMARKVFEKGWLRLASLKVDGREEAVLIGIAFLNSYYPLQMGVGLQGHQLRAGNVLLYRIFESLIGRVKTFHFLRGNERYKYQWGAVDRYTINMTLWRGWKGRGQYLIKRLRSYI